MNLSRPRQYRFASAAHWSQCVLHRFDSNDDGSLAPTVRLGLRAEALPSPAPLTTVAVDPYGTVLARVGASRLIRRDDLGAISAPVEIDAGLGASPRWIADREWLWGFTAGGSDVRRYDRETLQLDLTVDVRALCEPLDDSASPEALGVLDIASDGREGIWILIDAGEKRYWLLHIDCAGRQRTSIRLPCQAYDPREVAAVNRGRELALLSGDGKHLLILGASDGALQRTLVIGGLAPCWSASRMSSDVRNRMALWGQQRDRDGKWLLFVLDASGDTIDGPLGDLFSAGEPTASADAGAPDPGAVDLAVGGDSVWFATTTGLRHLGAADASSTRESESTLMTPALVSPESSAGRGWLRAEVTVDLPRGAVLEAEMASTNDQRVADRLAALAADRSMTAETRQRAIWELLDHPPTRRFVIPGPSAEGLPICVPLFDSQDRWLWLRLNLITPPGTTPPAIRELRVLYPDVSLMQYLPAIFRGEQNDPGALLRRMVGVLECTTQRIDERIRTIGSSVNPDTAPDDWLDYLARWLDLPWDDGLSGAAKRRLLQSAGELIDRRGTRDGLLQLLDGLLGPGSSARIVDLTVEHPPMTLGGRGRPGSPLPVLLAGASPKIAILNEKAVLGRARLACDPGDCSPLREVEPALLIELTVSRATQIEAEPLLARILAQYVPAGIKVRVRWKVTSPLLAAPSDGDGFLLDANGPGSIGSDSVIGRTVLHGRRGNRIDDAGLDIGFPLR